MTSENLIQPLSEISEKYLPDRAQEIKVGLRTGDTTQSERQKMLRNPPHIMITTPESLAIAIASPKFQPIVSEVEYMIIDEASLTCSNKAWGSHESYTFLPRYLAEKTGSEDWYFSNNETFRNSS